MTYDVIIVGGGIVGLATGLQVLQKKQDNKILILEKEHELAQHQTGNNSGVIHSGIYYKPGSLKAKNCVKGYHMLLKFCDQEDIPYELCSKVIVATSKEEIPALNNIYERGLENGLKGLTMIHDRDQIKEREPYVNGVKAIHVKETGIIDYKKVSFAYARKFQELGGEIKTSHQVLAIHKENDGCTVETTIANYKTRLVVTCGGLHSDKLASMTMPKVNFRIIPFRGEYYKLRSNREHLVKNLIYPVPDPNFPFLGVHFTRMINGGIEAGPNAVFAFQREGYKRTQIQPRELWESLSWPGFQKVARKYWKTGFGEIYRSFSKSAFTRALQKLLPDIRQEDLKEGGAGVRAQACDKDGGLIDDFLILEDEIAVHVCNAPSPAATSSLAIGDTVADLVIKRMN